MARSAFDPALDLLLGPPGRQRNRVRQSLLVLALYLVCAVVQYAQVMLGLVDPQAAGRLMFFSLAGALGFTLVIRSGLNRRVRSDPSLTFAQCAFGVLVLSSAYAITGAARGGVMSLLMLILVFSMFTLPVRSVVRLNILAFGMLAGAMVWKSHDDPLRYPPVVEVIHFAFAFIVVLSIGLLSARMTTLRLHLRQQKSDLEVALERIRLLATEDDLTGLVNRRHMSELMDAERLRASRSGETTSLVLLDIDFFKQVNDQLGHKAGDAVLRHFARVAGDALRGSDVLARWGGDEFLLMLPATSAAEAADCIERLRAAWDASTLDHVQVGLRVSFCAGIADCRAGESLDLAVERADEAMYRAKAAGRHCTMTGPLMAAHAPAEDPAPAEPDLSLAR